MTPEELLAHSDFIRNLSRSLVLDANLADEVVQETWLAAVRSPPGKADNPRSWLSMTLRNVIRMLRRAEHRRRRREQAAAVPEKTPSAAEIAAREEVKKRVAQAVLSLQEPYRSALLLHYFKAMTYREIAKKLNVPLETVRTRIKRGLVRLRTRLDADYEGKRSDWLAALLPFSGLTPGRRQAGKAAGAAAGISGLAAWMLETKVWQAAVLLLAGAALIPLMMKGEGLKDAPAEKSPLVREETDSRIEEGSPPLAEAEKTPGMERELIAPSRAAPPEADPLRVTWQGSLIDHDGTPLGNVVMQASLKTEEAELVYHEAVCDEKGCFEFQGLAPGEYVVELHVPVFRPGQTRKTFIEWGDVLLDEPGLVKRDIRISEGRGALVCGTVVYEASEEPVRSPSVNVGVTWQSEVQHAVFSPVEEETGRFCFRCLPPGTYHLTLQGPGLHVAYFYRLFEVAEGQVIEDLRVPVPPLGLLLVTLNGFEDEDTLKGLILTYYMEDVNPIVIHVESNVVRAVINAGDVVVKLEHPDLGAAVKAVKVDLDETANLTFSRIDLTKNKSSLSITGRLKRLSGEPVRDALLNFFPDDFSSVGERHMLKWAWTDRDGRFVQDGFYPDIWNAQVVLLDPGTAADLRLKKDITAMGAFPLPLQIAYLRRFVLRADSPDPAPLELVLHSGEVKGVLCDAETGMPFTRVNWKVIANVSKCDDYCKTKRWSYLGEKENTFHIKGVPEGIIELSVNFPGYMNYYSGPFELARGEIKELGEIPLVPSGILDLKVTNPEGEILLDYRIDYAGAPPDKAPLHKVLHLPGRLRISGLPSKTVTLNISAPGYLPKYLTIDLKPCTPVQADIVLQPVEKAANFNKK